MACTVLKASGGGDPFAEPNPQSVAERLARRAETYNQEQAARRERQADQANERNARQRGKDRGMDFER